MLVYIEGHKVVNFIWEITEKVTLSQSWVLTWRGEGISKQGIIYKKLQVYWYKSIEEGKHEELVRDEAKKEGWDQTMFLQE